MNGLSLDQILSDLGSTAAPATKTAAAAPAPAESAKVKQAAAELKDALKRAEQAPTKTAAAKSNPVADLEKTAADLAAADQEALVKEANFYGAAICDGFMARLQQFEKAAEALPEVKTAGETVDVEKIAAAAVQGYVDAKAKIKTAAEQSFNQGYTETMAWAEKVASDVFGMGAQAAEAVLTKLASAQ